MTTSPLLLFGLWLLGLPRYRAQGTAVFPIPAWIGERCPPACRPLPGLRSFCATPAGESETACIYVARPDGHP
jgi:hypothetical protein